MTAGQGGDVKVEPLEGDAAGGDACAKRHLVVLVNGLFGSVDNWDVVVECLQARRLAQSQAVLARLLAIVAPVRRWLSLGMPALQKWCSANFACCTGRRSWGRLRSATC